MVESVTIKNAQLTPEIGKQGMEAPAEQPSSDKPSWLPEKFKSGEDFKAYSELEKHIQKKSNKKKQQLK